MHSPSSSIPFHRTLPFALCSMVIVLTSIGSAAFGAELVHAKDGSGYFGYKDTPKLPWCEWVVHDPDRPAPPRVVPGHAGAPVDPPADAIVLFGGKDLSAWQPSKDWQVNDGLLVAGNSRLITREEFGDIQLHVEWMSPEKFDGPWSNRGNNGVFLMGLYELQIFDSHQVKIYPDGACGAIYGQTPPRFEATRAPGQWQALDIVFTAPRFAGGKLVTPARATALLNNVLVQHDTEIHGETGHRQLPAYRQQLNAGPLVLGGHGCPLRFRNVWLRRL